MEWLKPTDDARGHRVTQLPCNPHKYAEIPEGVEEDDIVKCENCGQSHWVDSVDPPKLI